MSTHTKVTGSLVVKALVLHSQGSRVQFPIAAAVTLLYFLTCVMPMDMFCSRYIHMYVHDYASVVRDTYISNKVNTYIYPCTYVAQTLTHRIVL